MVLQYLKYKAEEGGPGSLSARAIAGDPDAQAQIQRNKQLDSIIKALEQNKDNPKYIMRALDDPDPDKKINNLTGGLPRFAMGIPTSEILAGQQQARISDVPPVSKEQIELE